MVEFPKANSLKPYNGVYFKMTSSSISHQRTHNQSIKFSLASPLLTVGRAENLIITITMPASLVCFDKALTSQFTSLTMFIPTLLTKDHIL